MAKLQAGDIIEVFGWVMLAKLDAGRYRISKVRERYLSRSIYDFTRPKGKRLIVTHYSENVDAWLREKGDADLNRIEIVSRAADNPQKTIWEKEENPLPRSFFVSYQATKPGQSLLGGVKSSQSSRWQFREDAEHFLWTVLTTNKHSGIEASGQISPSADYPEIFIHCGDGPSQAIGGKCFCCKKVLTIEDAKQAAARP